MIPSLLITLREVIEAALIVATILGILTKLGQKKEIRTVWLATTAATIVSVMLLGLGSAVGLKMQELYSGPTEEMIEGILMLTSAVFITWAVFFLHTYFSSYKTKLLVKIKNSIDSPQQHGLFILVFTAVFREGFEIVLFLSTIYFSSHPQQIFSGFIIGALIGLCICFGLFKATIRMPVYYAFRTTSLLLILFAAGLLSRGVHEFAELGMFPEIAKITFAFLPPKATFAADIIKAIFGITQHMDMLQLSLYLSYVFIMHWWVFVRPTKARPAVKVT